MEHYSQSDYQGNRPKGTSTLQDWHGRSPGEQALEPELPIVDAHHHLFGTLSDVQYYRLEELGQDMAGGHRVIGTVYVEAYYSGWRTTGPEAMRPVGEVEKIVGITPARLPHRQGGCQVAAGIVSHADLTLGEGVAEVLEAQLAAGQGRLRGIRHMAAREDGLVGSFNKERPPWKLFADPVFRRGFAQLARFGLSFDAWVYHHQLGDVAELADAFPDTGIVLDHVGGVIGVAEYRSQRSEVLARWEKELRALAARPNVHVKIGGMGMPVYGFGFEQREKPATSAELVKAWQPFIDVCIDAFGPQRCMFESNFPVDKQSCGYTELWNAFKLATGALSPGERSDMFYRTACRFYRLPELADIGDKAAAAR